MLDTMGKRLVAWGRGTKGYCPVCGKFRRIIVTYTGDGWEVRTCQQGHRHEFQQTKSNADGLA